MEKPNNKIVSKTEVYTSVDIFKFIAAALIVCIHTRPFNDYPSIDLYWQGIICQVAVPFFFCFSSYIFFKKGKSIGVYIKRMLSLYMVWFIIEIPIIYFRFFYHQPVATAFNDFIIALLFRNTFYASWFITASCQAMLLVYFFSKFSTKLLYLTGLASFGVFAYFVSGGEAPVLHKVFELPNFIQAIPYVTLGYYMATHDIKDIFVKQGLLIIALLLGLAVLEIHFVLPTATITIFPLTFILTSLLLSNNYIVNTQLIAFCRKSSILIWLLHGIFQLLLAFILKSWRGVMIFSATYVLSVIMAYIIIKGSNRFSLLRYLY